MSVLRRATASALRRPRTPRRALSTNPAPSPPPAGGHLPSIATSSLLRTTRDASLRTPAIQWRDPDPGPPVPDFIAGRETRKMNLYQAVRDAMRSVRPSVLPRALQPTLAPCPKASRSPRTTPPSSLARTSPLAAYSAAQWSVRSSPLRPLAPPSSVRAQGLAEEFGADHIPL